MAERLTRQLWILERMQNVFNAACGCLKSMPAAMHCSEEADVALHEYLFALQKEGIGFGPISSRAFPEAAMFKGVPLFVDARLQGADVVLLSTIEPPRHG